MSPSNDRFISASVDGQIFLWDLSNSSPLAKFSVPDKAGYLRVSFDPEGSVISVLLRDENQQSQHIKLYNPEELQNGPFSDIAPGPQLIRSALLKNHPPVPVLTVERYVSATWTDLEFSPGTVRLSLTLLCLKL